MITIVFVVLLFSATTFGGNESPICCFPEQFEAFMFTAAGDVDLPTGKLGYGYGYTNGTIITAFDAVNQLSYTHEDTLNFLNIYPIPIPDVYINILDYKNNVQWRVYADGSCDKYEVGLPLYKECIPGNASLMYEGTIGPGSKMLKTFIFHDRIYLDPYEVTVTVLMSDDTPGECIPVRMSISRAYVFDSDKNVDIAVADISDFTPGIKDMSIFIPPSSCDNTTIIKKSSLGRLPRGGILQNLISTRT